VNWIAGKRVLIVAPTFEDWDLGAYVTKILERKSAGVQQFAYYPVTDKVTTRATLQKRLLETCKRERPHLLLGLKMDMIDAQTLRKIRKMGIIVALWYVDCFSRSIPGWLAALVQQCDIFFSTAQGLISQCRQLGATPAYWVMEGAYLPAFPKHEISEGERRLFGSQVAFVGSIYHRGANRDDFRVRESLLRKIGDKYDLKIWGIQRYPGAHARLGRKYKVIEWPAYNRDWVKVCRSADIMLGINLINSVEVYFSNRTFLTLAGGGFHLTHYVPGLETMFENHRHLVWFHSEGECLELVEYYLQRPQLRESIAREGQEWTRNRYSMTKQVGQILKHIQRHYGKS
jgi:hypothetical protein